VEHILRRVQAQCNESGQLHQVAVLGPGRGRSPRSSNQRLLLVPLVLLLLPPPPPSSMDRADIISLAPRRLLLAASLARPTLECAMVVPLLPSKPVLTTEPPPPTAPTAPVERSSSACPVAAAAVPMAWSKLF